MMKLYKILFFNTMITGTLIVMSALSWFSAWIGLEINLLSIIPLLKNTENKFPSEATMKYFFTQAMGSSFIMFSIIFLFKNHNSLEQSLSYFETTMISSALLLKMGAAPFHFWLPEVMSGLNWTNNLILLTWQKIAPSILLTNLINKNIMFFSIIIIVSSMISGLQGLNQICLRKILAYSSINHVSWMITTLLHSFTLWVYYFLIYCIINLNIIMILKKYNIFFMNQLSNSFSSNKKIKLLFLMNFLSLGGLPPFLGFLPKWLTINSMIEGNHYMIVTLLIIFTLMALYFYLRVTFSSFTINSEESLILMFNKMSFWLFTLNLISLLSLISCSFIDSGF